MGVVQAYVNLIRGWLDEVQAAVLGLVLDGWDRNPVHFSGQVSRGDSDFITKKISGIKLELEERLDPAKLGPTIQKFALRVSKKNGEEFRRVIGITSRDTGLKTTLDHFQDRNVAEIKSLAGKQLTEIRGILEEGEIGAARVEDISKRIQDSFGVTKSKGDLLARDQVLQLNADLTKTRQTNAGITKYIWTTSNDERVRPDHAELDGTVQSWAAPPVVDEKSGRTGNPGDDYQCRCIAFPVLEELDEDAAD